VCALVLAIPGQPLLYARGECRGRIATQPRGSGGFGYDPIFEPETEPPGGRTFGEWSAESKHRISHRGRAAREMASLLAARGF
jgi:XTP/dITP diphosphohydrolase